MVTLVVDTNILVIAFSTKKDFNPKANELMWRIVNAGHSIAIDEENRIASREYKKFMRNNQQLTTWWRYMNLKKKIVFRSGSGTQFGDLKELDNCFACVAMRTPDRILVTENTKHFNEEIKKKLAQRNVKVLDLEGAYNMICRSR